MCRGGDVSISLSLSSLSISSLSFSPPHLFFNDKDVCIHASYDLERIGRALCIIVYFDVQHIQFLT